MNSDQTEKWIVVGVYTTTEGNFYELALRGDSATVLEKVPAKYVCECAFIHECINSLLNAKVGTGLPAPC